MSLPTDSKVKPALPLIELPADSAAAPGAVAVPEDTISYTVDKSGTIIAVNGKWDEFARDNQGEKVLASKVIGRKLDQFIQGDDTRMFVRTMIMSAQTLKRPIYRPYRCDSPRLKRFMEMTLIPRDDGSVELLHRELHSELIRQNVPAVIASKSSGGGLLKRCSLCNRVQALGVWSEIDEALESDRLKTVEPLVKVIYGVCPDCLARRGMVL
jgi:hypothetical protein